MLTLFTEIVAAPLYIVLGKERDVYLCLCFFVFIVVQERPILRWEVG